MAPPFYDHAGRILDGRYELVARVGAGSFATVYRAIDRNVHDRVVAVKVLHPERASDQATVQRFVREVKLAVRVTGKHRDRLVQILDQGFCEREQPGLLYFVMEFVEGATLQRLLREATGGVFPWRRAVVLGHEVAQALAALHRHGVIHRDIKPGNCILEDDRVRLLDLGIAKLLPDHESSGVVRLTLPNMIVGTLRYMAPEQQSGNACDERADLYAVGVMLYEFLTGSGPVFREMTEHPAVNKPLALVPPSQVAAGRGIPPAVDAVVVQALCWRLEDRFQTAAALSAALEATLSSDDTDEFVGRPRNLSPRARWLFATAHALGVWMLFAGTAVAAASLAFAASLAQREGVAGEPVALERDDTPARAAAETVVVRTAVGVPTPIDAEAEVPVTPALEATSPVVDAGSAVSEAEAAATSEAVTPIGPEAAEAAEATAETTPANTGEAEAQDVAPATSEEKAEPKTEPKTEPDAPTTKTEHTRAALAARYAAQRKRAIATCTVFSGLADPRGLRVVVRVQVAASGKVQARAKGTWMDTPLGNCVEDVARSLPFAATDLGGSFTWTLQF